MIRIDESTYAAGLQPRNNDFLTGNHMEAKINGFSFSVNEHDFWPEFNADWERDTKKLYSKYVFPDKKIVDVGAGIGPTVLMGYANNANKHICAIEADPVNAHILKRNCKTNFIDDRVTIINKCIFPTSGEIVNFGKTFEANGSSTKSLGDNLRVCSSTLKDIIDELDEYLRVNGNCRLLLKPLLPG